MASLKSAEEARRLETQKRRAIWSAGKIYQSSGKVSVFFPVRYSPDKMTLTLSLEAVGFF